MTYLAIFGALVAVYLLIGALVWLYYMLRLRPDFNEWWKMAVTFVVFSMNWIPLFIAEYLNGRG